MKTNKQSLTVQLGLLFLLSGGVIVNPSLADKTGLKTETKQAAWGHHEEEHRDFNELGKLNLSPEQKKKIAEILKENRPQMKKLGEQLRASRKNSMEDISAEKFHEDEIRKSFREVSPIQEDLAVLRGKTNSQIIEVLTPDQRKSLKEMRDEAMANKEKKMNKKQSMLDKWINTNN